MKWKTHEASDASSRLVERLHTVGESKARNSSQTKWKKFTLASFCDLLVIKDITFTAEPAYSNIVYSRFLAIVELNLIPFAFISLLFYPCYSRLLL